MIIPTEVCEILIAVRRTCSCDTNFLTLACSVPFLWSLGAEFSSPSPSTAPLWLSSSHRDAAVTRQGRGSLSKLCLWKTPPKHQISLPCQQPSKGSREEVCLKWGAWHCNPTAVCRELFPPPLPLSIPVPLCRWGRCWVSYGSISERLPVVLLSYPCCR